MTLRLLALTLIGLALPACESLPPINAAYSTRIGDHKVVAAYTTKDGIAVAAERK